MRTSARCRTDKVDNKTLTLSGPKAWSTKEIIELCEDFADTRAQVTTVPAITLQVTCVPVHACHTSRSVLRSATMPM